MRRPRVDRAGGKRRSGRGSPATWLGLAMLAIMLAGAAAWVWRGAESPATQQVVAVAQPPQQAPAQPVVAVAPAAAQPAPAQQAAPASQQALLPPQPPAPHIADARLAEIDGLRHSGTAVYRLVENPRILLIDFPTLAEQGRAMNRLAALIEKSGTPHDRVLSPEEMAVAVPIPIPTTLPTTTRRRRWPLLLAPRRRPSRSMHRSATCSPCWSARTLSSAQRPAMSPPSRRWRSSRWSSRRRGCSGRQTVDAAARHDAASRG